MIPVFHPGQRVRFGEPITSEIVNGERKFISPRAGDYIEGVIKRPDSTYPDRAYTVVYGKSYTVLHFSQLEAVK